MIHNYVFLLFLGLTSLEPEKRFSRICKNLCLLLTALFHFIHNNVSPVLMSLTAGQRSSSELQRHLRALSICFFLIVASLSLMIILWQWFTIGNNFLFQFHSKTITFHSEKLQIYFHSDFSWNQSWRVWSFKICHFVTFRDSGIWFLWIYALVESWNH